MITNNQAIEFLNQNKSLQVVDGQLACSTFKQRLQRFCFANKDKEEIQKIATFIESKFATNPSPEAVQEYLQLADAFIARYASTKNGKKISQIFERTIAAYCPEKTFIHPKHVEAHNKWLRYGLPSEIYQKHTEFCDFLERSNLQSQMKITRDTIREIDGEAAILVCGEWTKWSDIKKQFSTAYSKQYNETFIVDSNTRDIYTYLDNGKGLQPHHPFRSEHTPISTLDENAYQKVLETAHKFVRPGEETLSEEEKKNLDSKRTFVLQLVTSYVKGPNTRLHKLLSRPKHPYLRIVIGQDHPEANTKKGEVYEVGYGWKQRSKLPFSTTEGQFRSPDIWEYKTPEERIVTNIPITQEEAQALQQYTLKYHRDSVNLGNPIAFDLRRQNCSTYIRKVLQVAGVNVPTKISIGKLIQSIMPAWMEAIGRFFHQVYLKTKKGISKTVKAITPRCVSRLIDKITAALEAMTKKTIVAATGVSLLPLRTALGGNKGHGGEAFVSPDKPQKTMAPALKNWKNWFSLNKYRFNLPGILQRWQREQASTVIYKKHVKLAIVPE